ncbi:MAG TPA: hypothetical protein VHA15_16305 [Burkholderiales bacterium]|nr:hypothetical protein [Burkholderiales bacterium]
MKRTAALGVLLGLAACSTDWRTSETVTPVTWQAEVSRPASSVGRLARLAILAPVIEVDTTEEERSSVDWQARREQAAVRLQAAIADYLRDVKGYDTVLATDRASAGAVDGYVVSLRYVRKPWSTGKALGNLFLANVPLFMAMSAVNLRVEIAEAATGRVAWRGELKGEVTKLDDLPDMKSLFGNMDNAVPAILRR